MSGARFALAFVLLVAGCGDEDSSVSPAAPSPLALNSPAGAAGGGAAMAPVVDNPRRHNMELPDDPPMRQARPAASPLTVTATAYNGDDWIIAWSGASLAQAGMSWEGPDSDSGRRHRLTLRTLDGRAIWHSAAWGHGDVNVPADLDAYCARPEQICEGEPYNEPFTDDAHWDSHTDQSASVVPKAGSEVGRIQTGNSMRRAVFACASTFSGQVAMDVYGHDRRSRRYAGSVEFSC